MPGLRSLVARRRSSLASTPPCSPHSRTDTPSPSSSFPPSDHASLNASLSRSQGETENHCLMPGSGSDSTGGDEGLQKEKEVDHELETGLRGEALQTNEEGRLQEGGPGQRVQQDATSRTVNLTQETTLINGGDDTVESGNAMSIETEPTEESRSTPKVWSEVVSCVHESTYEGTQTSVSDAERNTLQNIENECGSDEKKDINSVVEDNIVQDVEEKSTAQWETSDIGSSVKNEVTNKETAILLSVNKDSTRENDNDQKIFHKNESSSQLKEISLTERVRECTEGNIRGSAHAWKNETSVLPNISEEGANQDSWSSDFLDVVESRRLSSACEEESDVREIADSQKEERCVSECEEKPEEKGSLRDTEAYVGTGTHLQSEGNNDSREDTERNVLSKKEKNDMEFSQDKTGGGMEVGERFEQGVERAAEHKYAEESKGPEDDQYPQRTESKDCEVGEESMDCDDCGESTEQKLETESETTVAEEKNEMLEGATSSTYFVSEKEDITDSSQEEGKDCFQLKGSEIDEEVKYENVAGTQNYYDDRQASEYAKEENEYDDERGLLNYENWGAIEPSEVGKDNIEYEGREEYMVYKDREESSNFDYQQTFNEYGSEEALDEYGKETRIHKAESGEIAGMPSCQDVKQAITDIQLSEENIDDKPYQSGNQTLHNEGEFEFGKEEEKTYEDTSNRFTVQGEIFPSEETSIFERAEQGIKSSLGEEIENKSEFREDFVGSQSLGLEVKDAGEEIPSLRGNDHEVSNPITYDYLKQDQGGAVVCSKEELNDGDEPKHFVSDSSSKEFVDRQFDESMLGQLTGETENYDALLDLKDSISEEGEPSELDSNTVEGDIFDKEIPASLKAEDEEQFKMSGEDGDLFEAKADMKNEEGNKDEDIVIEDGGVSSSGTKPESSKDDGSAGVNNKRPYPFTVSPKVKKGPGRCSELSATEIESTLASRGVTIVRRMVDSKENSSSRGNSEASQNLKRDAAGKSGVVVTPHMRNTRQSARLLSLYKTHGRPNLKEYGPVTAPGISNTSRPIIGPGGSGITKDLYKSINARGTLIHPGSKTPQSIAGAKGMQFNTRGVSIQFNPKGVSSLNLTSGGTTIYSKTRGPNIYTNTKGSNMQMNPKGVTVQTAPRMFSANTRTRGPVLHSLRGANPQANPRALATMANQRGMMRPMRYSSPRGLRPSLAGMNVQTKSPAANPRMRGINPQSFKVGTNQMQSNTPGYSLQTKSSIGLPAAKSGAVSLHSTISNISTQSRSMKVSPNSQSTGMTSQFKPGELLSQTKSGTGNIPLQSNIAGMSPQQQRSDGMLSPPNRPAEMSPHSRSGQMPSQSVGSGIYAQAKFTGLPPDSSMGPTQQGMMMDQSKPGVTGSTGGSIVHQPRSGLTAGHLSVPSSSQHLAHLSMMDYSTQSGSAIGLSSLSSASNRLLPPHSVPGMMQQGGNSLAPQLGLSSGLTPLATSESFASATSEGFSTLSHSEFLGRSTTETFSPYNTLSGFPPHSSTATDFTSSLSSGDFSMQSSTGGFPSQTNLVGFSPQTNPCGYPPHVSSGGFSSHSSGTVIGHSGTDSFAAHPNCGSFTPAPVSASGYPPHSTAQLYNTPANANDILGYSSSRDFMMNPSSREFSPYSGSNQLTSQLPQDISSSGSRDFSLQNPSTGISMPSNAGTIVGDQYTQPGYGDPMAHSSYQQDPLQTRSNPSEVPLLPDLRDSVPVYGNYRDPVAQETLRTSQLQGSYRDMPHNSSLSSVQPHGNTRAQNIQANYKDQPVSSAYRDQDIIANYLESSVLSYRDQGDMGSCPEQTNPAYRPASSHTSPSEQQVLPSFSNPASHASPQEQVLSNYSESASPRDQVLSQQPCRDNTGQMGSGESVLPGFRDSMNSSSSAHQDLSGFRDSMTYPGCRESGNYNIGYEKPGSNTSDYASSTSSRHSDVTQGGRSNTYKDPHSVPGFRLTDPSSNMKDIGSCNDNAVLPSFTESFDSTSPNDINRKDGSSTLSHYKPMSEYGSLKGSPASVSTESTCATSPFVNHHTGEMSPLANEYPHSYGREPSNYQSKRIYGAHPHDSFSPAQYSDEGGGGHHTNIASNSYPGIKDQFFPEASNIRTTITESTYCGPKNSIAKSDMTGVSQPVVSDSQQFSGISNVQGPSGTSIYGKSALLDEKELPKDASSSNLYQGDKGPFNDTQSLPLGFHNGIRKNSTAQAEEVAEGISYQPFLSRDGLSPTSPIGAVNKFPSVSSPTKSDSNSSPSTQERIVIKMKLLHANSAVGNDGELVEDASVKDTGTNNKNSIKYSMAKYTRWTIDSIINGSEEGSDGLGKEEESKVLHGERDENSEKYSVLRKGSRQRTSESSGDVKDTSLDTNKNLMKKSIKITITNPLRARISSSDEDVEVGKGKEKKSESKVVEEQKVQDDDDMQVVEGVAGNSSKGEGVNVDSLQLSKKNTKNRRTKSPSPTPSLESCSSASSVSRASCDSRRDSRSSDSSTSSLQREQGDPQGQGDLKKCSIVIKRIYTENNYSCYSSSLCEANDSVSLEEEAEEEEEDKDASKRRPKRRAAVEASERCHKTLRPLDYNTPKTAKVPILDKGKENTENSTPDKVLIENSSPEKALPEDIPQCSVLLYDVFMDSRLNKLSCPGCSRHYDSTDSIQVNISKATISLLCSGCRWLVVKGVRPHEIISSLAPS